MIFLYYDKYGKLKEWINDTTQREGNSGYDTIYWYMEEEPDFTSKTIVFERPDDTKSIEKAVTETEKRSVPYSKTRNYKYFKDYQEYLFNKFTLTSDIIGVSGAYKGTIRNLNADSSIFTLGEFSFNVEGSVIKDDANISQSQYDYLWTLWSDLKSDTSEALTNTEKALEEIETKLNEALSQIASDRENLQSQIDTSLAEMEDTITTTLESEVNKVESSIASMTTTINEAINTMQESVASELDKLSGYNVGGVSVDNTSIYLVDDNGEKKVDFSEIKLGDLLVVDNENKRISVDINANTGRGTTPLTTLKIGSIIYYVPKQDLSGLAGLASDNIFTGANTFDATLGINVGKVHLTEAGLTELETQAEKIPSIESKANNAIPKSEKGVANGVATLDVNGKLPNSQLDLTNHALLNGNNTFSGVNTFSNASGIIINGFTLTKAVLDNLVAKANKVDTIEATANNAIPKSLMGAASGVATLDSNGKVLASQLPEDFATIKEYPTRDNFPAIGEENVIYVAEDTNISYRWAGSSYVISSSNLALGETSSTAYAGDKGKKNADNISALTTRLTSDETNITTNTQNITNLTNNKLDKSAIGINASNEVNTIDSKNIHAAIADKATSDANGNNIASTYETKANVETIKNTIPKGIKYDEETNTVKTSTNASDTFGFKTVNGQSIVGSGNIESTVNVPVATNVAVGGILADAKTDKDLVKGKIGSDKYLYVDTENYGIVPQVSVTPSDLDSANRFFEKDGKLYAIVSDDFDDSKLSIVVDTELNATSTNAISNKAVTEAINDIYTDKQDTLNSDQLNAVNSGITANKVRIYDNYNTTKQDKLTPGSGIAINGSTISVNTVDYNTQITNKPTIPSNVSQLNNDSGFITSAALSPYLLTANFTWANLSGKPSFASVATSGDYNDLTNKPTIPTNTNQLTNGSGYVNQNDVLALILASNLKGAIPTVTSIDNPTSSSPSIVIYNGALYYLDE